MLRNHLLKMFCSYKCIHNQILPYYTVGLGHPSNISWTHSIKQQIPNVTSQRLASLTIQFHRRRFSKRFTLYGHDSHYVSWPRPHSLFKLSNLVDIPYGICLQPAMWFPRKKIKIYWSQSSLAESSKVNLKLRYLLIHLIKRIYMYISFVFNKI